MKNEKIEGYAILWDQNYAMSGYIERVSKDAFKNADMTDVRLLVDHNPSQLLARNASNTLTLKVDSKGLFFSATLPNTSLAQNTAELMARGDLSQMSWGFMLHERDGSTWSTTANGVPTRIVSKVSEVLDVSLVCYPCNPATWAKLAGSITRSDAHEPDYLELELEAYAAQHARSATRSSKESSSVHYETASLAIVNEPRKRAAEMAAEIRAKASGQPAPKKGDPIDLEFERLRIVGEIDAELERLGSLGAAWEKEHARRKEQEKADNLERARLFAELERLRIHE